MSRLNGRVQRGKDFWRAERITCTELVASMPEQLLTLEQVAEYLNVDKFTVYRLLNDKELPAFKVGNQWRSKRKRTKTWLRKTPMARARIPESVPLQLPACIFRLFS